MLASRHANSFDRSIRRCRARVKRRTEQELAALPGLGLTIFRPAYIRGDHGAKVREALYRISYALLSPLGPLMRPMGGATSNSEIGRAMIVAAGRPMHGAILDSKEINELAAQLS